MKKEISAVNVSPGKIEIREFAVPDKFGSEDGLLKVEMAGVCGGDPGRYYGKASPFSVFPLIMGHEIVGRIEEAGEALCKGFKIKKGDRVVVESLTRCNKCFFCLTGEYQQCEAQVAYGTLVSSDQPPHLWGAYGQYMYIAPGSVIHKISEEMPAAAAVCITAVVANGIRWIRNVGQASVGNCVVIQGVGPQGLAGIIAAKESGAYPVVATGLTIDQKRFELAKEFGADVTVNVEKEDAVKVVKEITGGTMADLVLDVTGNRAAMDTSLRLLRKQGTLVYSGRAGKEPVPMPVDDMVSREIVFKGAFTHNIKGVAPAVKLAESRKYPIEKMVTHHFPLEKAEDAVKMVAGLGGGERPGKVVIVP
ncbi:MAG: zinc-binding dehydrogenase [Dehalococcoidia bacterium]|nr:zinc-binding dehydrogenase [Dehalococcoidia bacterium]MDZ4245545.1 zinc-binding dehydrogenase [Dehalococcoidia bacterium]